VLLCDASQVAVSAVLHQEMQGQLVPVKFSNRLLTAAERRYSVFVKEALAVIVGCKKYRPFLEQGIYPSDG
jgi:hypothetical protein